MRNLRRVVSSIVLSGCATFSTSALADSQTDFFAGKEIRLIVGTAAGGGYDTYARLVAQYLGRQLVGQPFIVVQNMPGASGVKAVNYLYAIAPKDGLTIVTFNNAMPLYQALGYDGIQFKTEELSWIGSLSQVISVMVVWHTTGVRTLEDAKHTEVLMGASGSGMMATYPAVLNATLGTKFKIISGYRGGNDVDLAMERGEVQGKGSNPWTSWKATRPDWVRDGKIVPIVQFGPKKDPELPDVPLLIDLATNDEQRQMFEFLMSDSAFERPFAAPPKIPPDRLNTLRQGFEAMTRNSEFLSTAKSHNLDIAPLPGETVQKLVARVAATPPRVVQKVKEAAKSASGKGHAGAADSK